jgi:hypothetical protein
MTKLMLALIVLGLILMDGSPVLCIEISSGATDLNQSKDLVQGPIHNSRLPETKFEKLEQKLQLFKEQAMAYATHVSKFQIGQKDLFLSETRVERSELTKTAHLIRVYLYGLKRYHLEAADRTRVENDMKKLGNWRVFYDQFSGDSRQPPSRGKSISNQNDLGDFVRGDVSTFSGIDVPSH